MGHLQKVLKSISKYLRELCGETDYERYRARVEIQGLQPVTPEAFYLAQLQHKYSRPNRCC